MHKSKVGNRVLGVVLGLFVLCAFSVSMAQSVPDQWTPVTEQRLNDPDPGEWLHFRRTIDSMGYSPLSQIDKENVGQLEVQWAWSTGDPERWEPFPTVANGVMYIAEGRTRVNALDAVTGDVLWVYQRERQEDIGASQAFQRSRGVTFYEDIVLYPTADMFLVALEPLTGEVLWEVQTGDYTLGYGHTSPPLMVGNKAIIGSTGGERGARGFIAAIDVEEGELLWRTWTVPEPGEPGSETWDSHPLCAAAWWVGSYDPELNVIYKATGQPCPWGIPETGDGDRLYSNSILALDADTGEILWHFAQNPNESWDHDSPYENILTDLEIDGEMRQVLVHTGKSGWGIVLDRVTGEFLDAWNFAYNNTILDYSPEGRPVYNPDTLPWPAEEWLDTGRTAFVCPPAAGTRNVGATSYDPSSNLLYIPTIEHCADMEWRSTDITPGQWNTGVTGVATSNPQLVPGQDYLGIFRAVNVVTGETVWEHRTESGSAFVASALATSGGIVFAGTADRWLYALDSGSGDVLWRTRLNGDVTGGPITYEIDGRQYVAVPAGGCGLSFCRTSRARLPNVPISEGTGVMWVFALPEVLAGGGN